MKKIYNVTVKSTVEKVVQIEAEDKEDACSIVKKSHERDLLEPTASKITAVQYSAEEKLPEKIFNVEIKREFAIHVPIHAYSKEDALERAEDAYYNGDYDMEFGEHIMGVLFQVEKQEKDKKKELER